MLDGYSGENVLCRARTENTIQCGLAVEGGVAQLPRYGNRTRLTQYATFIRTEPVSTVQRMHVPFESLTFSVARELKLRDGFH